MKQALTLSELAQKAINHRNAKRDFFVPSHKLTAAPSTRLNDLNQILWFERPDGSQVHMTPNQIAERQIATHLGIPARYWDRCKTEAPRCLSNQINTWLQKSNDRRLLRLHDTGPQLMDLRAFLSPAYRRIDNDEVIETIVPALQAGGFEVRSAEITLSRLYIQAITPRRTKEVRTGDAVQVGVIIKNSEVGLGSFSVEPLIYRLVCYNGMVMADNKFRKTHLGRRITDDNAHLFTDEARLAENRAMLLQARDVLNYAASETAFDSYVRRLQIAAGQDIDQSADLEAVVEVTAQKLNLTQDESTSVLNKLAKDGDFTKWGLANAVTYQAHAADSYDRAVELEHAGAQVIDLSPSDWSVVSTARKAA